MQFHEELPEAEHLKLWFPDGEILVLDDFIAEESDDKELQDLLTRHSHHQNITVFCLCWA